MSLFLLKTHLFLVSPAQVQFLNILALLSSPSGTSLSLSAISWILRTTRMSRANWGISYSVCIVNKVTFDA